MIRLSRNREEAAFRVAETIPMRVVYLNPCGQMGGAEMSLMDMLGSMRAAEPDWRLSLLLGEQGPLVGQAQAAGVHVIVAPFPRSLARLGDSGSGPLGALWSCFKAAAGTIGYARNLRRTLSGLAPDIVHTNGFKMHVLGAWASPKNTPLIWHVRDYVSTRPLMKWLLRLLAGRCDAAIGNSLSVANDIQTVCGRQLETLCVYNAIDLKRYSPTGETTDLDSLAGLAPASAGTVRVGLVATLAHWKGHAVFLRALARLPKDLPIRAYVIGGAIYQTENSQRTLGELRALAAELGIADKVGFTGYIADTAGAIRALDILVHASTQPEPFGRVIAEGMACGRAVICSAAGGSSKLIAAGGSSNLIAAGGSSNLIAAGGSVELITDGEDALAHPPGDDAALADRIAQLVRDPQLRARLGKAGRITAERRFERSRLAAQLVPLYQRLSGQATPQLDAPMAVTR